MIKLRKLIVFENEASNSALSENHFSTRKIVNAKFIFDLKNIELSVLDIVFV